MTEHCKKKLIKIIKRKAKFGPKILVGVHMANCTRVAQYPCIIFPNIFVTKLLSFDICKFCLTLTRTSHVNCGSSQQIL